MLYLANDHAGFKLKQQLIEYLQKLQIDYVDLGTDSENSVDFPVFCKKLICEVEKSQDHKGILICGSGIGMSICANRNPNIRAALCKDVETAMLSRQHNDANVLILAGRSTSASKAKKMLHVFLTTDCLGGKYLTRMQMIDQK